MSGTKRSTRGSWAMTRPCSTSKTQPWRCNRPSASRGPTQGWRRRWSSWTSTFSRIVASRSASPSRRPYLRADRAERVARVGEPGGDVRQVAERVGVEHRLDRAALGVAADDDVLDVQRLHRVLDHRRRLGLAAARRRHDVPQAPLREQLAGAGPGEVVRGHPRVGAGDEQIPRALPLGQLLVELVASAGRPCERNRM